MKFILRMVPVVALLTAGVIAHSAPTEDDPAAVQLMAACPMSVRVAEANDKPDGRFIIKPEHVATLQLANARWKGEVAVLVTLTAEGEKRMLKYTSKNVGETIIVFCGDNEISRAIISAPFANKFRVNLPDKDST